MPNISAKGFNTKCPFYLRDDSNKVLACEGIDGSNSHMEWHFKTKEDRDKQMEIFCCDFYKNCEVYRMILNANYLGGD